MGPAPVSGHRYPRWRRPAGHAAALLDGCGTPGLARGLPPLALLGPRLRHVLPLDFEGTVGRDRTLPGSDLSC